MKLLNWLYKVLNPKYTQWLWFGALLGSLWIDNYVAALVAGVFYISDRVDYQIEKTRTINIDLDLSLNDEKFSGTVEAKANEKENI